MLSKSAQMNRLLRIHGTGVLQLCNLRCFSALSSAQQAVVEGTDPSTAAAVIGKAAERGRDDEQHPLPAQQDNQHVEVIMGRDMQMLEDPTCNTQPACWCVRHRSHTRMMCPCLQSSGRREASDSSAVAGSDISPSTSQRQSERAFGWSQRGENRQHTAE